MARKGKGRAAWGGETAVAEEIADRHLLRTHQFDTRQAPYHKNQNFFVELNQRLGALTERLSNVLRRRLRGLDVLACLPDGPFARVHLSTAGEVLRHE